MTLYSLLSNKSTEQILSSYELPSTLVVYYASQCAKSVMEHIKDPRSLKAIEIAERFGNGEEFTQEFLNETASNAAYAANAASYASNAASYASNAASYASAAAYAANASSSAASYAAYAANAAYAASNAYRKNQELMLRDLLINIIDTGLSGLEKGLIFGFSSTNEEDNHALCANQVRYE